MELINDKTKHEKDRNIFYHDLNKKLMILKEA